MESEKIIYLIFQKDNNEYQKNIVNYFKLIRAFNKSLIIKIIIVDDFIIEKKLFNLIPISATNYIFWNKYIAGNNLSLVKRYINSIVVLERKTIYLQKVSKLNPINETVASNHGFYILYLDENTEDITNSEYKLIVPETFYQLSKQNFLNTLNLKNNEN